ncbi:hypothetical protein CYK80_12340 [Clostridium perfringens]|uniref:Uncharacterized protein n=1 Tax=Clostridium perfringens TaxID=1502 RepID=A0AB37C2N7_CLOPF|nr:hypothetical protein [Clostridium perfringens]MDM0722426.1 hypothetical protein [Clostridium perfringens]MDM0725490.1 hypothetical protein [Clostridium perfringens]MDU6193619.1 hypothetical protein [Clostridium perfringens]PWX37187.1 hypothetical protein CYK91_13595 [Clostridium perfringens]PZT51249.1 hypothetical protein CYK80_12340 [Clostridium perfringens]
MNTRKIEILKEIIEEQKALIEENKDHEEITEMLKSSIKVIEYTLENEYKNPTEPMVIIKKEPENTDLLQERESDLKQLTNGLIFKNWKEVCGFMGWKETGGDYKKAKLKELDTMCKWHKEGNKIVVDEVYENNVKFEDNTRARKGKYNVEVGSSVLAVVASKEDNDGVVYLTQKELIVQTALANGRLFSDHYAEGFSKLEVISYKDIAKKMTYKAIDNGLKWLNSARVLKNDKVKIGNVLNPETGEYELRELDSKEGAMIFEGEQKILRELGYDNIFTVMVKNEFESFGNRVTEYVYNNYGLDISYYYSAVRFIITKFSFERGLELATKKLDLKKELWDKTHKALVESAVLRKEKKCEESKEAYERFKFGMDSGFVEIEDGKSFVNPIYAYVNYVDNFIKLDKIYRG